MKNTPALSHCTLVEVQTRFTAWRKTRKSRERIPEDLWSAAVTLHDKHSINKISRTLRLNHSELRNRIYARQTTQPPTPNPPQDFIAIDMVQSSPAECIIEMEHRNGNRMRMHFKGRAALDFQAFAESFWS